MYLKQLKDVDAEKQGVLLFDHEGGTADDESTIHPLVKVTRHKAPHEGVTHRKPPKPAKASNPKELLMVLAPSMGNGKGHDKQFEA